jgi:hypothetical protein
MALPAFPVDYHWVDGAASGFYTNSAVWFPDPGAGNYPSSADSVFFTNSLNYAVLLTNNTPIVNANSGVLLGLGLGAGASTGSAGNSIGVSNGAALVMSLGNGRMQIGVGGNGDQKGLSTNVVSGVGSRWVINGSLQLGGHNGSSDMMVIVTNGAVGVT